MDFEALQIKFRKLNLDNRTAWQEDGDENKEAVNDGYKEVYNKARQDRSVQEVMKSDKTLITMSGYEGTMPSDFLQPVDLYIKSSDIYTKIDDEEFPYRYIRESGAYKVIFDIKPTFSVYVEYIPVIADLSNNADESVLPEEFDGDILNFALVEYFRKQRDWMNVTNSLQYAEGKMGERVDQFWLD